MFVRALCEIVGRPAEPYVVPLLAAAVDEWREAAAAACRVAASAHDRRL